MRIEAITDSYSIFNYLAAAHLKLPAEKSTYFHLAYLREKLECGLIHAYNWVDTRDMIADGLTKGSADRSALSAIMDGRYKLQHAVHEYREPKSSSAVAAASSTPCMRGSRGVSDTSATAMSEGGNVDDFPELVDVSRVMDDFLANPYYKFVY